MQAQTLQPKDLFFYDSNNGSHSPVMLQTPERVQSRLLKPLSQICYLWVTTAIPPQTKTKLDLLQSQGGPKVIPLANLNQVRKYLFNHTYVNNVLLICPPNMPQKIQTLKRKGQIHTLIEYPAESQGQDDDYQQGREKLTIRGLTHVKLSTESRLLDFIKTYPSSPQDHRQDLTDFVGFNDQAWKQNILLRTIIAMIKQQEVRLTILGNFKILLTGIKNHEVLAELLSKLMLGPLPKEIALDQYTKQQLELPKIINSLLHQSHPTEAFYLQPIFKDIFNAIEASHAQNQTEDFVCYKEAILRWDQIKKLERNAGSIIKNLCFMPASLKEVQNVNKNTLFEIVVKGEKQKPNTLQPPVQCGYAKIKQQVIFNSLCSFQILEVKQVRNKDGFNSQHFVKLLYRNLQSQKQSQKLEKMSKYYNLDKSWRKFWKEIKNQGHAMNTRKQRLYGKYGVEYWRRYAQVYKSPVRKMTGWLNQARFLQRNPILREQILKKANEYQQSLEKNGVPKIPSEQQDFFGQKYQIVVQFARFQLEMGRFIRAQRRCQQHRKSLGQTNNKYSNQFLMLEASALYQMCQYQSAVKLFIQLCQKNSKWQREYDIEEVQQLMGFNVRYVIKHKISKAKDFFSGCLKAMLKIVNKTHSSYLYSLNNFYITFYPHKAERSISLAREAIGEDTEFFVKNLIHFGVTRLLKKDGPQAFQIFNQCMKICQQNCYEQPQLLSGYIDSFNCIEQSLFAFGNFPQIQRIIENIHSLAQLIYGEEHPLTIESLIKKAIFFFGLEKTKQAQAVFENCKLSLLNLRKQTDLNIVEYLPCFTFLAEQYLKLEKIEDAKQLIQKCSGMLPDAFFQNNKFWPKIAQIKATILSNKSFYQASKYFQKSYNISIALQGKYNPETISFADKFHQMLIKQNKNEQALQLSKQIYEYQIKFFEEIDNFQFNHIFSAGQFYLQRWEFKKAQQIQLKHCEIQKKSDTRFASCLMILGSLFIDLGIYKTALKACKKSMKVNQDKMTLGTGKPIPLLVNTALIYHKLGETKKAHKIIQKKFTAYKEYDRGSILKAQLQIYQNKLEEQKMKRNQRRSYIDFKHFQ